MILRKALGYLIFAGLFGAMVGAEWYDQGFVTTLITWGLIGGVYGLIVLGCWLIDPL